MRLTIDIGRTGTLLLVLAIASCSSAPPPADDASAAQPAVSEAVPSADGGAPLPEPPLPEPPTADDPSAAPPSATLPPIAEEPESPFGESAEPAFPPAEPPVALSDAPLPPAPKLPSASKPPVLPAPAAERPQLSPPAAAAPRAPAAPVPRAQSPLPAAPPIADAPIVKEPKAAPPVPVPDAPAVSPSPLPDKIDYSREVRLSVGQLLEIPYRGTGWIFLGELNGRKGLPYDSRRLDAEGQAFMFRGEGEGEFVLKFYRQDFVNDYIVNDYVKVAVEPVPAPTVIGGFSSPVDRGRVVAEPRWPPERQGLPAAASAAASAPPASVTAAPADPVSAPAPSAAPSAVGADGGIQREAAVVPAAASFDPSSIPENAAIETYLEAARREAAAGRVDSALAVLDRFRHFYPAGSDESWWLYGKLLESNGPAKDVKAALSYYRKLVDEYPQSPRYAEARKRIAYLQRYYFDIR